MPVITVKSEGLNDSTHVKMTFLTAIIWYWDLHQWCCCGLVI